MANRFILAAVVIVCWWPSQGNAQRAIGVAWEMPADLNTAQEQLQRFSELGLHYLRISQKPSEPIWDLISDFDFKVYAQLPIWFPVEQTFTKADSNFKAKINNDLQYYASHQSVKTIGLFSYGQVREPPFRRALYDFMQEIDAVQSYSLYFQTARAGPNPLDSLFAFKLLRVSQDNIPINSAVKAYIYIPKSTAKWNLAPVKKFLEQTPNEVSIPVFFNSEWLLSILEHNPEFANTLKLYANVENPVFALPEKDPLIKSENNAIIISLLLAWMILAGTYFISPVFRKSFVRYFVGHQFFVKDVMQRHIRTKLPGISILAQHALLGGIVGYCIGNTLFSGLGFKALITHYPFLSIWGEESFALFWWGFFITLLVEMICTVWLRFTNAEITRFDQIYNLYPWPLQLNIAPVTIMTAIFVADGNSVLVIILAAIFLLLFASAFIITSFDTASFLDARQKRFFLPATSGLYVVLIIGFNLWILFSARLLNVIELAIYLP